jgi:hypothetical protein
MNRSVYHLDMSMPTPAASSGRLRPAPGAFAAPLLLFSALLMVAGAVNLAAGPDSPYWAIAAPVGLLGVLLLAFRRRTPGTSPWLVLAWALVPVAATRAAATATGDIAVADTVLGLVVAGQALLLGSRPLVLGGLLCAVLSAGFGLVLTGELAREVVISLTSGAALAAAAVGVVRAGERRTPSRPLATCEPPRPRVHRAA